MKKRPRPVLVAIVGGSGAGKTWLARQIAASLRGSPGLITLDDFYKDLSHLPFSRRVRVNFDHPRSIEWPLLERVLRDLRAGGRPELPLYDFATHCRRAETRRWSYRRVVLCEGLWLLGRPSLRRLFDLRIYVDCPAQLRLRRRIARDTRERDRTSQSVLQQWRRQVLPMHRRFVAPQRHRADVIFRSTEP
jgi:uridine kinase